MKKSTLRQKGFTLIAALLLLLLLSGVAVSLMYLVNGESHMGGSDMNYNLTYYAAESGMEQLTASLAALYSSAQSPTPASISALAATTPTTLGNGINFNESITWANDPANPGNPLTSWNTISSGANQGLVAEIVPLTLTVNAYQGPLNTTTPNAATNITRNVEVALIPVFQFGIFADGDISYFAGPTFQFKGRVHTNGSLYLASGSSLTFFSKVTAFNQIIRDRLENNHLTSSGYTSPVYIPNASGGCDSGAPATNCLSYTVGQASWSGGIPPAGAENATWITTSTSTYKGFVANSKTGVNKLTLPFVGPNVLPIEIIRKPLPNELAGSAVSSSRLFNKAQIRVLLADTQNDLHPGQAGDANDVFLNGQTIAVNPGGATALAMAKVGGDAAWTASPWVNGAATAVNPWPLVNGWLRVEYKNTLGNWVGVTNEWLGLGFARGIAVPTAPGNNAVHPNAILILQELADRNGDGVVNGTDAPSTITGQFSWYPINFFDAREGFPRDTTLAGTQCNVNGIMNAVEIDVGNLRKWLKGTIAGTGTLVDFQPQNGYVLYFSDRRGETINPNLNPGPPAINGEYGFEDVVNWGTSNGTPDGVLDTAGGTSAEDVNGNGRLDNWGVRNVGDGFLVNTNTAPPNPYKAVDCLAKGRQNRVTGARHVLRLVDGSVGNLPTRLDNDGGGFTVASENPVYVLGNYNASAAGYTDPHAAAAIIADAVTLL
ncbi:MAG: PilX N-terminal domain-containing pilus assembly protein, partial [Terriglobales bacterium]